jgi:hypothetical protein
MAMRSPAGFISAFFDPLKNPNAPTIGTATDVGSAGGQVTVTFTAPANVGGSAITAYYVVSNPDQITTSGASSPITVSGLTNGTAYTFNTWALNSYGPGVWSAASNSATPTQYIYPGILTQAYFLLDNSAGNINRYTYTGNTVATGTALTIIMGTGSGAGNSIFGIFAQGNVTSATRKYTYSSNTTATGASMPGTGNGLAGSGSASNSTTGIWTIGSVSGPGGGTQIYTYSSDTVASGPSTQATGIVGYGFYGYAAGNSSNAIFANGAGPTNDVRWKYNYSGNTLSSATSSSQGNYYGAACGPSTYGIFALGYTSGASSVTNKYTYSSDSSAVSTSLTTAGYGMAAAGGNSVGIFTIAYGTTTTNVWTYSGDTVAAGTNLLGGVVYAAAAASNGTTGVNV